jgi:DNA-binding HxlR family transcriptional regulator
LRAGAKALSLLAAPLNVHVLTTLAEEPCSLYDLRRAAGSPPQTTMRGHLRKLTEIGVLKRWQNPGFPGSVDYELGEAGEDLLEVAALTQQWLGMSPEGPISLGEPAAKISLKALVDGWSSGIVRVLAARPLSLTDLNRLISELNYPSLERRLGALRFASLIEAAPAEGRGTPYQATAQLRRAIGPMAAAARWERRHWAQDTPLISRIDVEAAFLLALPAARLSSDLSGSCRLGVEIREAEGEHRIAGVLVQVEDGRVVSCVSRLQGEAEGWAVGTAQAWIDTTIDGRVQGLEIGGNCSLAREILDVLHPNYATAKQRS